MEFLAFFEFWEEKKWPYLFQVCQENKGLPTVYMKKSLAANTCKQEAGNL